MRALLATSLLAFPAAAQEGGAADMRPPSVVLVMVDDLGSADLGCTGGEHMATPRLDRMAAEGMRFTQAYAGAPVCAPSRATLLTGYHGGHASVRGNTGGIPLRAEDVTVAQLLQRAGYATGGFGKWGLGDAGTEGVPERHGFDVFLGNYHQIHAHYFYTDYLWRNGERIALPANAGFYEDGPGHGPVDPERTYSHGLVVEATLEFIREHADEPFFCYAAWNPPHGRYEIPADDPAWALYSGRDWPLEARVAAAMTTMVDRQVGRLLDLLDELEIADETLVLFCSDNGGYTGVGGPLSRNGDLRGGKTNLYEGGLRVPLIAHWPGRVPAGVVSDLPTYFPDLLPTLCDVAGAPELVPADCDGLSILPTLLGGEAARAQERHDALYWEYTPYQWGQGRYRPGGPQVALRSGSWKLVRDSDATLWQLYDLATDPREERDVAAQHRDLVATLAALAQEEHVDPPPQVEPEKPEGKRYR